MRFIALAAVLALLGSAAHAVPTPVDFATISMTTAGEPRTVSDTVCVTDGRDLTCDRQMFVLPGAKVGIGLMPSSTTANGAAILTVATDGPSSSSSLGNSAVEIESKNRNASLIISNPYLYTGQMIFRNGGLETTSGQSSVAYQNGFLRIFVSSSTPALTVTSNSQVGLGLSFIGVPQTALQVSGTIRFANGGEACDANRTGAIRYAGGDFSFCRNGSVWETLTSLGGGGGLGDRITSGTSAVVVNSATGIVSISQLGAVASYVHPSLGYVGPGVSATGTVSGSKVATNVLKLSGVTSSCATVADEGAFFYDTSRKRLQVCSLRN